MPRYAGGATRSRPGGPCRALWLRVGRLIHWVPRARLTAHGTRPASRQRAGHRFVGELSRDYTIRNYLQEDAARGHLHTVVVAPIYPAKLPALLPGAELLKEAVSRARLRVGLDRVAAVLLA